MKFFSIIVLLASFNAFAEKSLTVNEKPSQFEADVAYDSEPPTAEELRIDLASMKAANQGTRAPASVDANFKLPQ